MLTLMGRDGKLRFFKECWNNLMRIFNALVEKIDVISPVDFVFEKKNGVKVEC